MVDTTLSELLHRNARHVESLPGDHFADVRAGQAPAAVSMCCADSRVSQEGMWDIATPGWLFTPSTIGNQVWDVVDDRRVVDGSVLYPLQYTGTEVALVVGHTGCGAITAALEAVTGDSSPMPAGVQKWIELLVPVVESAIDAGVVTGNSEAEGVNQLVEHNVDRQIAFLRESDAVDPDVDSYGFVYDFHGAYGDRPGLAYLVNANGETDVDVLRERVPEQFQSHVRRLR